MKLRLLSTTILAAVALAGAVAAQDETTNWTGFYAGVNLGGAFSLKCSTFSPTDANAQAVFTGNNCPNNSSFIGGGQIGAQYQFSSIVIGLEADISGGTGNSGFYSRSTVGSADIPAGTYTVATHGAPSSIETIRPRLGYAFDKALIYVTGGGIFAGGNTNANFTYTPVGATSPTATFTAANSGTRIGYVIGGGIEYALTSHWSVRAEDLYSDIGTLSNHPYACNGSGCVGFGSNINFNGPNSGTNLNIIRVGVNYRIGGF